MNCFSKIKQIVKNKLRVDEKTRVNDRLSENKIMPPKATTQLLFQLRELMKNTKYVTEPIQAYIIPSNDAHNSEYLADTDKFREFISGFTGSAGTAIVTDDSACLWTDGRYYLQASEELDQNWTLMKEGIPSTPTQDKWLSNVLPSGSRIGVDPKLYPHSTWNSLQHNLDVIGHQLVAVPTNLISLLWKDRPARPNNPVLPLGIEFTGKTIQQKLDEIRAEMLEKKAELLVVTALDEVAWLLNLRGSDIEYNPVFFSYVVIESNNLIIFVNSSQINDQVKEHLTKEVNGEYCLKPYDEIDEWLKNRSNDLKNFAWFSDKANHALTSIVPKKHLRAEITPICLKKAVKNPTEIAGMRNAHIKDGVALCSYFAWLEKNLHQGITEISGAEKLEQFRAQQENFVGPSFETINGVGPHGAIIHYKPTPETNTLITNETLYLCDSGGQYKDGTTDVTRTFHFGEPTQYEKECFTRVLKGQIKLMTTIFPAKLKGNCLDAFAREALWSVGLDYAHGTGHGIGSYLNVHEGPMGISWRPMPDDPGLEAGMFLSDEPGYYEDGKFGIRIEDIVQVVPAKTPHNFNNGGFLTFETITFAPKQTKMIIVEMLTDQELEHLNSYHQKCREILGPLMEKQGLHEAKQWLWKETEPLKRV